MTENTADYGQNHLTGSVAGLLRLASFQAGHEEFGLNILKVQEIIRTQELRRVPNLPEFVEGIINLRGRVIPVIGLHKCFGLEDQGQDKDHHDAPVEVNWTILGSVVDAVSEVLHVGQDTIEPPPQIGNPSARLVNGKTLTFAMVDSSDSQLQGEHDIFKRARTRDDRGKHDFFHPNNYRGVYE